MSAMSKETKKKRSLDIKITKHDVLLSIIPLSSLAVAIYLDYLTVQTHSFVSFVLFMSMIILLAWWRDITNNVWLASWAGIAISIPAITALDSTAGNFSHLGVMLLGILTFITGQYFYKKMTISSRVLMLSHSIIVIFLMHSDIALFRAQVPVLLAPVAIILAAILFFLKRAFSDNQMSSQT